MVQPTKPGFTPTLRWLLGRAARLCLLFVLVTLTLGLSAYLVMVCDPGSFDGDVLEEERKPELKRVEAGLRRHVTMLAKTIGPRDSRDFPKALERTADYIVEQLQGYGYRVTTFTYEVDGQVCRNLEVTRKGTERPEEIILIGAHYDSISESPGANDNGSGTAALLELARLWASKSGRRTVRFVAFANEEPPHFMRDSWGARIYARMARARSDQIKAMLSLETLGYYSQLKGSQKYPPGFREFYPDTGNFVAIVGNISSRPLVRQVTSAFREATRLPAACVATFGWIHGVNWSDHAAFWEQGYPAVMLTDTAPFRYPHYHTAQDTPDKLDYSSFSRATLAIDRVIETLSEP